MRTAIGILSHWQKWNFNYFELFKLHCFLNFWKDIWTSNCTFFEHHNCDFSLQKRTEMHILRRHISDTFHAMPPPSQPLHSEDCVFAGGYTAVSHCLADVMSRRYTETRLIIGPFLSLSASAVPRIRHRRAHSLPPEILSVVTRRVGWVVSVRACLAYVIHHWALCNNGTLELMKYGPPQWHHDWALRKKLSHCIIIY